MLWSRPPSAARKSAEKRDIKIDLMWSGSSTVGEELHHLQGERAILTDPEETRRRRTILLVNRNSTWGFTLQTYGIKNKKTGDLEVMTYVDYVELNGPACVAGMRTGDVLLSVNGESVEGLNHTQLVDKIKQCKDNLRLVVLFEDCCRKVELYERFIKLKKLLSQKYRELKRLEHEEKLIRSGDRLSRSSLFRESVRSSASSDWDRYSELASPSVLDSVPPNPRAFKQQHFFAASTETLDNGSACSLDYSSPFPSTENLSRQTSNESLKNSTLSLNESLPEKDADISEIRDRGSLETENNFYIGPQSRIDLTLLGSITQEDGCSPPHHVRRRSGSALLNDMRLKLIADNVNSEAIRASLSTEQGLDERENISIVRVVEGEERESEVACRLYNGVRINDKDEITRL